MFCSNMTELGYGEKFNCVALFIDNTSIPHVAGNQIYSSRTKHVALRFFYIRELIKEGKISIHYVRTKDEIAELGAKHVSKQRHRYSSS